MLSCNKNHNPSHCAMNSKCHVRRLLIPTDCLAFSIAKSYREFQSQLSTCLHLGLGWVG